MNSAHGEGKIVLEETDNTKLDNILTNNVPFFYADYEGIPTENYPFNP